MLKIKRRAEDYRIMCKWNGITEINTVDYFGLPIPHV